MVGEYHTADTAAITTTSFNGICQDSLGKPAPQRQTILDFTGARDDKVALASAGPHANHLPIPHHSVFYRLDASSAAQPTASKH